MVVRADGVDSESVHKWGGLPLWFLSPSESMFRAFAPPLSSPLPCPPLLCRSVALSLSAEVVSVQSDVATSLAPSLPSLSPLW